MLFRSLFGKKCSTCDGTGHIYNQLNYEISNLQIKDSEEKSTKSKSIKPLDIDIFQSNDKNEKTIEQEFPDPKNFDKADPINKKVNEHDDLNTLNSKEKNIITVDLSNDEKIVFSQLGINPLIKLGKEYLTSNNFVRLKDNNKEEKKA